MVEVQLLDRLRTLALRKRWIIGLAVGRRCRSMRAALVGVEGAGLASRAEVFAHHQLAVADDCAALFQRLRRGRHSAADAALLAAHLAECQAALLDEFAARIAIVWDRVLAVAVAGPGLWRSVGGLTGCLDLCDSARLAELSGLNVIDAFAARDLAQEGRGRPLLPIPYWILLHDARATRVLVELDQRICLTYLPASRDSRGVGRVSRVTLEPPPTEDAGEALTAVAELVADRVATDLPSMPRVEELVLAGPAAFCESLKDELASRMPQVRLRECAEMGVPAAALKAAGVAILGLLHLDQTPANATAITGARTPRVLGRLTPGSLPNWHRLVRELAAAKPSVVTLRSAV